MKRVGFPLWGNKIHAKSEPMQPAKESPSKFGRLDQSLDRIGAIRHKKSENRA
jgi:hypothetical protein